MAKHFRALIVDDELDSVRLLVEILTSIGWETFGVHDGEVAYKLFKRKKFELVITDIYMPRMSGLELLAKVKAESPKTAVILITAYAHYVQVTQSLDHKPDGFLIKPFDISELVLLISNLQNSQ